MAVLESTDLLQSETVPLVVRLPASISIARAGPVLADLRWLGSVDEARHDDAARVVSTDLELPIQDGSGPRPVRKSALIEVGRPRTGPPSIMVPIAWWSATFAPLFPVFTGRLVITNDSIVLDGRYVPPFGRLGLVLDRALLHLVAQRTAGALLARFASELS